MNQLRGVDPALLHLASRWVFVDVARPHWMSRENTRLPLLQLCGVLV